MLFSGGRTSGHDCFQFMRQFKLLSRIAVFLSDWKFQFQVLVEIVMESCILDLFFLEIEGVIGLGKVLILRANQLPVLKVWIGFGLFMGFQLDLELLFLFPFFVVRKGQYKLFNGIVIRREEFSFFLKFFNCAFIIGSHNMGFLGKFTSGGFLVNLF